MKRYMILVTLIAFSYVTFAQNNKISKKQALEIAKSLTAKQDVNVYISKQSISNKFEIATMYKPVVAPDYENYLIFIDEHPFQS